MAGLREQLASERGEVSWAPNYDFYYVHVFWGENATKFGIFTM